MRTSIHITGASGAGTSTLGRALAARLGARHLDTDDFYWQPLEPKFTVKRPPETRVALIEAAFADSTERGWVLSGSIGEWGRPLVSRFSAVIFLSTPTEVRLERLRMREAAMFGAEAIAPGGSRHEEFSAFIAWAAAYDEKPMTGRSRRQHEAWLKTLPCPVLRFEGTEPVEALVERAVGELGGRS